MRFSVIANIILVTYSIAASVEHLEKRVQLVKRDPAPAPCPCMGLLCGGRGCKSLSGGVSIFTQGVV